MLFCLCVTIAVILAIVLDILNKVKLTNRYIMKIFMIVMPHISAILYLIYNSMKSDFNLPFVCRILVLLDAILMFTYVWIKLNIFPSIPNGIENIRIRILYGGKEILLNGFYGIAVQIILYICVLKNNFYMPAKIALTDSIITVILIFTLIANGFLRIVCASKRLNIMKRLAVIWLMFIPIINVFVIFYICRVANDEYEHEMYKSNLDKIRADSDICKTKYPLVMIHGVGFRDFKYLNYWGRIPKELIKNGAKVFYGNQEAFGTVEYNANAIKDKILNIIKKENCEKVNIIAHSKGGLDARFAVSMLGIDKYVASVTTMSSPHRGVKFVDYACKLPDGLYKFIAKFFNKYFSILGDKNPDFYTATRQFSTYSSREFNKKVKDCEGVYYQSYASVMRNMFSDYILTFPYLLVRFTENKNNDGLVSVESAKWGEFKGIFENKKKMRGISHGDMIDSRRDDYKGFDVIEKYIGIVSELKKMGY